MFRTWKVKENCEKRLKRSKKTLVKSCEELLLFCGVQRREGRGRRRQPAAHGNLAPAASSSSTRWSVVVCGAKCRFIEARKLVEFVNKGGREVHQQCNVQNKVGSKIGKRACICPMAVQSFAAAMCYI